MLPVASFITMDVSFVITDVVGFHRGWCGLRQQDHPASHHGEANRRHGQHGAVRREVLGRTGLFSSRPTRV
jgi:hypothetical protein